MAKKIKPLLFWTSSYGYLGEAMLKSGLFIRGELARGIDDQGDPVLDDKPFADGERYHRLISDVDNREVIVLGGTIDDRETMELFDIGNLMVDMGAAELKLVIPYFGYSTMERAVKEGEAVKAKFRARLLSAIPPARLGNSVFLMDLHSVGTQHYFEGQTHSRHLYAKAVVIDSVKRLLLERAGLDPDKVATSKGDKAAVAAALAQPFVLASTDVGRSSWVDSLARDMAAQGFSASAAFIIKRRTSGAKTEVRDISADVDGAYVILYDDMVRTGGSLIKAARAYRDKGAANVDAILTHCLLPGNSKEKLAQSGALSKMVVTDSHPRSVLLQDQFLVVNSIANLLAENVTKGRHKLV
jgi:ribose-phosphate pyrophosphokinase